MAARMTRTSTAPSSLTLAVDRGLEQLQAEPPSAQRLERQLRHLAKWRSIVLANTLLARNGPTVPAGPFRGMIYAVEASEGGSAPRLAGAYEASLHPILETVVARGYPQVLDIGCAEGYYAVGLARRMPGTLVHAHDSDPRARELCEGLAAANGVADRLRIGGEIGHADLALCRNAETFILCDIEGAEGALLDPAASPALTEADLLVEVHEGMRPGLLATLTARFAPTHRVTRIDRALRPDLLPDWAEGLSDLDRLLLLWEWRATATPWLWMERR